MNLASFIILQNGYKDPQDRFVDGSDLLFKFITIEMAEEFLRNTNLTFIWRVILSNNFIVTSKF